MNTSEEKLEERDGYRRALKYLGIFGGAQGLSMFLNLLRNKCASVLLGTAGLSLITLFNRTIQMFSECTNLSLSFSAIRKMSDTYENDSKEALLLCVKVVRSLAFFTGLLGMLLMIVLSPLICNLIFGWNNYYLSRLVLLSPVVFFMAVSGGELAILRGIKQFSKVAVYNFAVAFASAVIAVVLYFTMGLAGIFPAMFFIALAQMSILLYLSLPHFPYKIQPFSFKLLRRGLDMVKMGAGYIYASILTACAMWLVCALLSNVGDGTTAGLFNAGFAMIVLLPGVLFASMDSEYFPCLSSIAKRTMLRDRMVNEHIEVQMLTQTPLLVAFVVALPILIPLFYDGDFSPAIPMAQVAMFGMFMRTMTYPISFLPLSNSDTMIFLVLELVYNILLVSLVVIGYLLCGMFGIGVGLALVHTLDFVLVYSIVRYKYKFGLSRNVFVYYLLQMPLMMLTIVFSLVFKQTLVYWVSGALFVIVSSAVSMYMLQKHSGLFGVLLKRLHIKRK